MVSICIATYNGEKYLEEQLQSIISQIRNDDEIIISDDGSNDGTLSIINEFCKKEERIKLFFNEGKHGAVNSFINAMDHSRGDIIFLADQDDVWLPNKLDIMLSHLDQYDLVHCNSIITDENLKPMNNTLYSILHCGKGIIKNIKKSTYFGSHMAFKREVFQKAKPFPNIYDIGHDLWIGLISEKTGRVLFIEDPLLYYRRHNDAHCDIFGNGHTSIGFKIKKRITLMWYLLKFDIGRLYAS